MSETNMYKTCIICCQNNKKKKQIIELSQLINKLLIGEVNHRNCYKKSPTSELIKKAAILYLM